MLVQLNKSPIDNTEYYNSLFEKMGTFLKDKMQINAQIDSLTTYYSFLNKVHEAKSSYELLRIPAEEEYFEIDANTRLIKVPTSFKNNGLSVQGDHTAETIFFRIPRYFDEMDLSLCHQNTQNPIAGYEGACHIQWRTAEGEEGLSDAYAFDITESELIFGWILSDTITNTPGPIEFSVRFTLNKIDNEISTCVYSWSSLPATCTIKPGLILTEGLQAEDLSDIVASRPFYSGIVNSAFGAVPIILINLKDALNLNIDDTAELSITAAAANTNSTVSISWREKLYGNNGEEFEESEVETTDERLNETDDLSIPNAKKYTLNAEQAGAYTAYLTNIEGETRRTIQANVCEIPAADMPNINYENSKLYEKNYSDITAKENHTYTLEVTPRNNENVTYTYQWQFKPWNSNQWENKGTNATWHPEEGLDGFVQCIITEHLNNTNYQITVPAIDRPALELRTLPTVSADDFTISGYTEKESNKRILHITVSPKENADTRDLYFIWNDGVSTKEYSFAEGGNVFTKELTEQENPYIQCQCDRRIWFKDLNYATESDRITLINERASTWDGEADA